MHVHLLLRRGVQRFSVVDNSDFSPSGLTAHSALLMIRKLSLTPIFSCEDRYVCLCVRVPARCLPTPVRPWHEVRSRWGAPKHVNTEGYACSNRKCLYWGITDAHIHALVGDGTHGGAERIQTFRCQACHTTFSARRDTPLYHLKTPSHQVAVVLSALAEGLDPLAAERVFGFRHATIHLAVPCWRARTNAA
jgi:hypothetical protein